MDAQGYPPNPVGVPDSKVKRMQQFDLFRVNILPPTESHMKNIPGFGIEELVPLDDCDTDKKGTYWGVMDIAFAEVLLFGSNQLSSTTSLQVACESNTWLVPSAVLPPPNTPAAVIAYASGDTPLNYSHTYNEISGPFVDDIERVFGGFNCKFVSPGLLQSARTIDTDGNVRIISHLANCEVASSGGPMLQLVDKGDYTDATFFGVRMPFPLTSCFIVLLLINNWCLDVGNFNWQKFNLAVPTTHKYCS